MNRNFYILSIVILVLTLPLVVVASRMIFQLRNSADPNVEPQEIVISNLSDTSATISWFTKNSTTGFINYGTNAAQMNSVGRDARDSGGSSNNYNIHFVTISNLLPNTQYYFDISSNAVKYTNGSSAYSFKTLQQTDSISTPEFIIGSVGSSIQDGVVYAHAYNSSGISTPIAINISSGNYAISKSNLKNAATGQPFDLSSAQIIISVTDQAGNRGQSTINGSTDKVPTFQLSPVGQLYNPNQTSETTTIVPTNSTNNPTPTTGSNISPTRSTNPTTIATTPTPITFGNVNTTSLLTNKVSYGSENSNPTIPYSIFISNISSSGFCLNWLTKQPTTGELMIARDKQQYSTTVDTRDSSTTKTGRYTHYTCFSASNIVANEKVGFFLKSNNSPFGINLSTEPFVFAFGSIPSSPPTPDVINGTTTLSFASYAKNANRDLILSARYSDSTNGSTWVSSVPTQTNLNWTLTYGSILGSNLSSYYTKTSASVYKLEANGEYNSYTTQNVATNTNVIALNISQGLSIISPLHASRNSSITEITGTAPNSTTVSVNINNQPTTVTANSQGRWILSVSSLASGSYTLSTNGSSQTTGLTFNVDGIVQQIPDSAISSDKLLPLGLSIGLMLIGIVLFSNLKSRTNEKDW